MVHWVIFHGVQIWRCSSHRWTSYTGQNYCFFKKNGSKEDWKTQETASTQNKIIKHKRPTAESKTPPSRALTWLLNLDDGQWCAIKYASNIIRRGVFRGPMQKKKDLKDINNNPACQPGLWRTGEQTDVKNVRREKISGWYLWNAKWDFQNRTRSQ